MNFPLRATAYLSSFPLKGTNILVNTKLDYLAISNVDILLKHVIWLPGASVLWQRRRWPVPSPSCCHTAAAAAATWRRGAAAQSGPLFRPRRTDKHDLGPPGSAHLLLRSPRCSLMSHLNLWTPSDATRFTARAPTHPAQYPHDRLRLSDKLVEVEAPPGERNSVRGGTARLLHVSQPILRTDREPN